MRWQRAQIGFTLLELLVAVAILAVITVMAYGGLSQVMLGREVVEDHTDRLAALQRALGLLQNDLAQAVSRPIRDGLGGGEAAMLSRELNNRLLAFTRGGLRLPPGVARSSLLRVEYGLSRGALVRSQWRHLDRSQTTEPLRVELLDDVEALEFRFMTRQGQWRNDWPPRKEQRDSAEELPKAVEMLLQHRQWGEIRRVMVVAP